MMLRACAKQLRLQKGDFLFMGGLALGAVALTEVIVNLVMLLARPESYFMLGPFLLFVFAVLLALILSISYWVSAFPLGLRVGATRREMVAGVACMTAAMNLLLFAFAALDYLLERTLGVGYWVDTMGRELEFDILYSIPWWGWPLAFVSCTVAGMLLGTVILRYGRKGFWVLWVFWMAGCFLPQLLPDDFNFPIIGTPLWSTLPWVTAAVVLVLAVLAVRTLLRLPVREQ